MADKIVCEFNLKVVGFCVHPLDHSENSYPSAADAPIDTSVPGGRNVPRRGLSCTLWYLKNLDGLVKLKLIHPPSPAVMLIPINPSSSAISKTSFCEAEVSDDSKFSLAQLIINSNDINKKIFLIVKFIKLTRKKYEIT